LTVLDQILNKKTKILAITHCSNVLGALNPIKKIIPRAHAVGAHVLIDGAQAIAHVEADVRALDCDFYVFSGHKMYGPTGIGVLFGKHALLNKMPPYQTGGDMIREVSFTQSTFAEPPARFEAGTPNIAGAIGLAAAIDFLKAQKTRGLFPHEQQLTNYCYQKLKALKDHALPSRLGVFSFVMDGVHPHDVAQVLDQSGVAVRTGHHCAMPLHRLLGVNASTRISLAGYNTMQDVDRAVMALQSVTKIFQEKVPAHV